MQTNAKSFDIKHPNERALTTKTTAATKTTTATTKGCAATATK